MHKKQPQPSLSHRMRTESLMAATVNVVIAFMILRFLSEAQRIKATLLKVGGTGEIRMALEGEIAQKNQRLSCLLWCCHPNQLCDLRKTTLLLWSSLHSLKGLFGHFLSNAPFSKTATSSPQEVGKYERFQQGEPTQAGRSCCRTPGEEAKLI